MRITAWRRLTASSRCTSKAMVDFGSRPSVISCKPARSNWSIWLTLDPLRWRITIRVPDSVMDFPQKTPACPSRATLLEMQRFSTGMRVPWPQLRLEFTSVFSPLKWQPAADDRQSHATSREISVRSPGISTVPSGYSSAIAQPIHQHLVLAAVDLDHAAVDEEGQTRRQISDQIGDLFAFGDAAERNARRRRLVGLLERQVHVARHRLDQAGPALGPHRAGIDGDEADIVPAVLAGERQRQILSRRVGGAGRDFPIGDLDAIVADQIEHAGFVLLPHDRQHVLHAAHIAHEFELQRLRPVLFGQMV